MYRRPTRLGGIAALTGLTLPVTGCSSSDTDEESSQAGSDSNRLSVTVPNGVMVLDAKTLDIVDEFSTEEFTRVNAAGDGRHVFLTTSEGFQLLDTQEPALTDTTVPATAAGHVVRHADKTVLFDDGTGTTSIFETDALDDSAGDMPDMTTYTADTPHHGVSIVLEDGTLLTTRGDEETRTGAMALEADGEEWTETASNDQCPGIHGEGTAADEAVVFGCEDGALLFKDGAFEKLDAPDEFGRMGNAYVSEESPIVVGDYKTDPDAEGYLLDSLALIDTEASTFDVVELPEGVEYTFRDVARGPDDHAYIIATDGSIHVLDPTTGEIFDEFPVVEPWEGPAEWQDAHPAITVDGDIAYVTEPARNTVHAVDLTTGEKTASAQLDAAPNEIAVALG